MGVAARRSDIGVPERGLHEVDGRTAIKAVGGMCVAKPMRQDVGREPRPGSRGFDDAVHGQGVERAALLRSEHRVSTGAEHCTPIHIQNAGDGKSGRRGRSRTRCGASCCRASGPVSGQCLSLKIEMFWALSRRHFGTSSRRERRRHNPPLTICARSFSSHCEPGSLRVDAET